MKKYSYFGIQFIQNKTEILVNRDPDNKDILDLKKMYMIQLKVGFPFILDRQT